VTHHGAQILAFPARVREGETWEPWVDERKVAQHFGVSTRTVRRWRLAGMPSQPFGGSRRFRLSQCERWHQGAEQG
jgi:phage terminase Nu1 subunit (DNA packaging protein)